MFWTWRATVCSLTTSSAAMARFVRPDARRRSTSSSRALRPWGSPVLSSRPVRESTRLTSGSAPTASKAARAASSSSAAPSSSPSALQARPTRSRTRPALVRRVELLPHLPRSAERAQRSLRLSTGKLDGPANLRRDRAEHRASVTRVDLVELCTRRSGVVDLVLRQSDFDVRGKENRPLQGLGRLGERAAERAGGGFRIPLCHPQEREARLRLAAVAACIAVRTLGRRVVAAKAVKLGLLVIRLPCRRPIHRLLASLAGEHRFVERVRPGAVQLLDPCAVGEAAPGERHQLGLGVAPAGERFRPLLRAPRFERLLAGRNHAAIDGAREERRDLTRGDGDHRLVVELQTLVHTPLLDERHAGEMGRDGEEIVLAEPLGDRRCV